MVENTNRKGIEMKNKVGRPATPKTHVVCYERTDGTYSVLDAGNPLTRSDALSLCRQKNLKRSDRVKQYFIRELVPAHVQINKDTRIAL